MREGKKNEKNGKSSQKYRQSRWGGRQKEVDLVGCFSEGERGDGDDFDDRK